MAAGRVRGLCGTTQRHGIVSFTYIPSVLVMAPRAAASWGWPRRWVRPTPLGDPPQRSVSTPFSVFGRIRMVHERRHALRAAPHTECSHKVWAPSIGNRHPSSASITPERVLTSLLPMELSANQVLGGHTQVFQP